VKDAGRVLIAVDAPLGWPRPMGNALARHRAGEPLEVAAHELFRRETDRFIRARIGKQSLDVGADRIARTAHSALKLLADVRRLTGLAIPMAWKSGFRDRVAAIEVYPSATLIAHGINGGGYKKDEKIEERRAIIAQLRRLIALPKDEAAMERSADSLDAAICVLAGLDFLRGEAHAPEDIELALHEGWIWVWAKRT
jgi:hypothetical protein